MRGRFAERLPHLSRGLTPLYAAFFCLTPPTHSATLPTPISHRQWGSYLCRQGHCAVTLPTPKLSNEWLIRLLFAAMSCIGTGATMYFSQWWAFLKDAPSRAEMDQRISEKVNSGPWVQERPTILSELKIISNGLLELKLGQKDAVDAAADQALAIRELQTLIKKDSRS